MAGRGLLLARSALTIGLLSLPVLFQGKGSVGEFTSASLPSQDSQIVLDEKHDLERLVKVDLLVADLKQLETSTAEVRQLMNAHGTPELKKNADTVVKSMNSLKVQSTKTFEEFNSKSGTALDKLHSALNHLAYWETEESHSDMSHVKSIIGQLTTSSNELSSKSQAAKKEVLSLVTDVGHELDAQQKEKERYLQEERQLQADLVELDQKVKNAASAAEKAKGEAEAAKQEALRQKKKLKKKKKKWGGLGGVAMKVLDKGFNIELHKPYTKRKEQAERQQRAFEEQAAKQREFAKQAESRREDLQVKKKTVDDTITRIVTTKEALTKVAKEVTEFAAITVDLSTFWETMQLSCEQIAEGSSVTDDIAKAAKGIADVNQLESSPFQMKIVSFHSKWMALKLISSNYLSHFKIQDEL